MRLTYKIAGLLLLVVGLLVIIGLVLSHNSAPGNLPQAVAPAAVVPTPTAPAETPPNQPGQPSASSTSISTSEVVETPSASSALPPTSEIASSIPSPVSTQSGLPPFSRAIPITETVVAGPNGTPVSPPSARLQPGQTAVSGTVITIDATHNLFILPGPDGNQLTIKFSPATSITQVSGQPGQLSQIKPGQLLTARGTLNAQGQLEATAIILGSQGAKRPH